MSATSASYLLGPVHPHKAMHLAKNHHFHLARIPELIMCLALLKLLPVWHVEICQCFPEWLKNIWECSSSTSGHSS